MDRMAGGAAAPRVRRRSIARAASWPTRSCSISICSGSPARSGRRRARGTRPRRRLFGDLPFMVDGDSADVWARQHQFRLDVSVGAPPDAFSATGQDWGMPVYRWDALAAEDFRWLRERARRSADLFDGYRVDHLVGFYRTYGRPRHGGERVLLAGGRAVAARARRTRARTLPRAPAPRSSPRISAPFPISCAPRSRVSACPAFACSAGSAHWHEDGQPFRDPADYPPRLGRGVRHARHRADGRLVGAARARNERAARSPMPSMRRVAGGADLRRRALRCRSSATSCSRRCSRRGPICCCCRSRMSSAGAIGSTSRRPSTTSTGRIAAVAGRSAG